MGQAKSLWAVVIFAVTEGKFAVAGIVLEARKGAVSAGLSALDARVLFMLDSREHVGR